MPSKSRNNLQDSPLTNSKTYCSPSHQVSLSPKNEIVSIADQIASNQGSRKMLPRFNQDANMFISEAPSSIGNRSPKLKKSQSPINKSHKAMPTSPDMED
jgi:hypothetical protein